MTLNSRTFRARTVRVQTANRIEVDLDLDFGVRLKKTFLVEGFQLSDVPEEQLRADAKHCLVVLVGGKNLIVRPEAASRDRWHATPNLRAQVYLRDKVFGSPVGYIPGGIPESTGAVLEIGPYMRWLCQHGFDLDRVKATMNGTKQAV